MRHVSFVVSLCIIALGLIHMVSTPIVPTPHHRRGLVR
jgi:hypothetical protein